MPSKLTKLDKPLFADDGAKRGPLSMYRLKFHPAERRLLAACADRRLAVFDLDAVPEKTKRGNAIAASWQAPHDAGWIRGLDVAPDGQRVATGGSDRRLKLWAWQNGALVEQPAADVAAHAGWVEGVAFSPDGQWLATAGADRVAKIWRAADLTPVATLAGHSKIVRDVIWSADGAFALTCGEDGLALVHRARDWSLERTIDFGETSEQQGQNPAVGGALRLGLSHDGRFVAVGGGQSAALFDFASGELLARERMPTQVVFHPHAAVFGAGEGSVKVWEYDAAKLTRPAKDKNGKPLKIEGVPGKTLGEIKRGDFSFGLAFSRDGSLLAAGRSDGGVEVWELS